MQKHLSQHPIFPKTKSTAEIIKEINRLELEVKELEEYLLSLYRKAFDHHVALSSGKVKIEHQRDCSQMPQDHAKNDDVPPREDNGFREQKGILDSSIHRSHSSLSHHSIQSPPSAAMAAEAVYSYHSAPLTLLERCSGEASDAVVIVGDHVSVSNSSRVMDPANWISEEMVRCISTIYCHLSATSVISSHDFSSPAVSFESAICGLVPHNESNLWSPPHRTTASFDLHSDAPFHAVDYEEFNRPCSHIVEIVQICRDSAKLREIEPMLQKFRSLVNKLEGLKPNKLKHEEKLAFWINVHNTLVMHAFLAHGVPQAKSKRISLLLKAAYNVGGHIINIDMIQKFILGRRLPQPGQWFHRLFNPKKKLRTGTERKYFALDRPEPLSYFGLSCASHSDPLIRAYTPKTIYQELIEARGEYILSNCTYHKEHHKIILPKIVDIYAKDSALHPADLMGIIDQMLPADPHRNRTSKSWKKKGNIGWIPHDFSFRCQLSRDLFH